MRAPLALFILLAATRVGAEWQTVDVVDEFDEPTGDKRIFAISTFDDGEHWCSLMFDKGQLRDGVVVASKPSLRCDYFNLTGRDRDARARIKIGDSEPVTAGFFFPNERGGQLFNYKVENVTHEVRDLLYRHAMDGTVGEIKISLRYYGMGNVLLRYPLAGLREALTDAGLLPLLCPYIIESSSLGLSTEWYGSQEDMETLELKNYKGEWDRTKKGRRVESNNPSWCPLD